MNGVLNFLKPTGMTSSDAVVLCRKILQEKKCGHMGTLDPAAAGVLPIGVGKCARLFDYFLSKTKTYRARFLFGIETDTLDSYGMITQRVDKVVSPEDFIRILPQFQGALVQIPPQYSALKIDGHKAYDLARAGVTINYVGREITIFKLSYLSQVSENEFELDIVCSAGTYIRSLVRDMAAALGTVGMMNTLIRLQAGNFTIENAVTLSELETQKQTVLLSPESVLQDLQCIDLQDLFYKDLRNGVPISLQEHHEWIPLFVDGLYRIRCANEFFGIAQVEMGMITMNTYLKDD